MDSAISELGIRQALSIVILYRTRATTRTHQHLVSSYNYEGTSTSAWVLHHNQDHSRLSFSTNDNGNWTWAQTPNVIVDQQWHLITAQIDTNGGQIFNLGTELNTFAGTSNTTPAEDGQYIMIGCSGTSAVNYDSNFLDGDIAEVMIFDRTLSAPERASLIQQLQIKWPGILP